jgi:hypothetical protein
VIAALLMRAAARRAPGGTPPAGNGRPELRSVFAQGDLFGGACNTFLGPNLPALVHVSWFINNVNDDFEVAVSKLSDGPGAEPIAVVPCSTTLYEVPLPGVRADAFPDATNKVKYDETFVVTVRRVTDKLVVGTKSARYTTTVGQCPPFISTPLGA